MAICQVVHELSSEDITRGLIQIPEGYLKIRNCALHEHPALLHQNTRSNNYYLCSSVQDRLAEGYIRVGVPSYEKGESVIITHYISIDQLRGKEIVNLSLFANLKIYANRFLNSIMSRE